MLHKNNSIKLNETEKKIFKKTEERLKMEKYNNFDFLQLVCNLNVNTIFSLYTIPFLFFNGNSFTTSNIIISTESTTYNSNSFTTLHPTLMKPSYEYLPISSPHLKDFRFSVFVHLDFPTNAIRHGSLLVCLTWFDYCYTLQQLFVSYWSAAYSLDGGEWRCLSRFLLARGR